MPLLFFAQRYDKMRCLSTLLVKKCLILCLCGAVSAPLCRGDWPVISPSTRAEHLLIHRIQSHTNPKRRKGFLKQAGQKSVKEELPKHRKGPKRTEECRLKVTTHIWENPPRPPTTSYPGVAQLVARLLWEQDAAGSNPVTRTTFLRKTAYLGGFSAFFVLILQLCRLLFSGGSRGRKTAGARARIAVKTAKSLTYP